MKHILLIALTLTIIACQNTQSTDLEDKKALLKEKKEELRALEAEIKTLNDELLVLDPPKEKEASLVEAITIAPKLFERFVDVQAKVEADDVVNISSEVGGRIVRLYVKEGQYVKRGQLIATTDLSTLEKQIAELENSLQLATTVYERQQRLWDQNIGSEIQYLEAKSRKEGLEKSLETLNSQISKKNIYTPISGIVDREFMQTGEMASPGMPLVQILNTTKVKIVADVQENFLKSIAKGDDVTLEFPALDLELKEKIDLVGRTVDLNNRTFEVEVWTSSQDGLLKPNLLSILRFKDFEAENSLVIPTYLLQEEVDGRKFVFKVEGEAGKEVAKKAYVEVGESNTQEIMILSGIDEGDKVVSLGAKSLANGDRINIKA